MRIATYSRFSSDQQRVASITDQQRLCHEFAARQGWTVVEDYSDAALSGASLFRPGLQALMRAAASGAFDIVVAESLDRLSRDQEDTAGLYKRLQFAGVRIVTVSEGDIGHLHVGLKGTMNALYLHELAEKTRRGLRGRVKLGRSGGGLCFGYRVIPAPDGQPRGEREINPSEAEVVRRIFREFVEGASPKAIAKRLNADAVAGPQRGMWSPSTIYGNMGRGTGILNNELYVGRLVWNRLRYVKDPDTGRRVSRLNPPTAWIVTDVPHLRIITDDVWNAAKERQRATRHAMTKGLSGARRPKYLFSGLTRCATCNGGFILSSHDRLTCFNAHSRGTCTNRRSIKRQDIESRTLRAMCDHFFDPEIFEAFCDGFNQELAEQRRAHAAVSAGVRRDLNAIQRRQDEILKAIGEGYRSEAWKAELQALDAHRTELSMRLEAPALPALRPDLPHIFRTKTAALRAGLEHESLRDGAQLALRRLLDRIVIPPEEGPLTVVGNIAAMLATASGQIPVNFGLSSVGIDGCGGGI